MFADLQECCEENYSWNFKYVWDIRRQFHRDLSRAELLSKLTYHTQPLQSTHSIHPIKGCWNDWQHPGYMNGNSAYIFMTMGLCMELRLP
eukprot:scaffold2874_cov110-Alexandrium_tamarense.AAC.52